MRHAPDISLDPPDDPPWLEHDEDCDCKDCLKAIAFQPTYQQVLEIVGKMMEELKRG